MMTSMGSRGDAKRFEDAGFDGYLPKPSRYQELFNVLSTLLCEKPVSANSAESALPSQLRPITTRYSALKPVRDFTVTGARILLVEDNITNQQVAIGMLKKLGLHADAAANGVEAIRALKSIPYDLVLMDIQMPVMDGIEATRQIRNTKAEDIECDIGILKTDIPIIAMTAHAMHGDRERFVDAGMNDYMSKPISSDVLADKLEKWLMPTAVEKGKRKKERERKHKHEHGSSVFNFPALMERLMDDDQLVKTIMRAFLSDIPQQIQALKGLLEIRDALGVERQAHTIKGAAANVEGSSLCAVAFKMEQASRAGDLDSVAALFGDLEMQFEQLRALMEISLKK